MFSFGFRSLIVNRFVVAAALRPRTAACRIAMQRATLKNSVLVISVRVLHLFARTVNIVYGDYIRYTVLLLSADIVQTASITGYVRSAQFVKISV